MRIGINIDHIATLRNARGDLSTSSLLRAIKICEKSKVEIITVHLREDRRHINDNDLIAIKKNSKIPINLEMALTKEMIDIALKIKPKYICIVPEKRKEITTEGGIDLNRISKKNLNNLRNACLKNKICLGAFVNPDKMQILTAKNLGFDSVEIHTGSLNNKKIYKKDILKISESIKFAKKNNLIVNVGHGLNFRNLFYLKPKKLIDTVHIGHFVVSESIFISLKNVVLKIRKIIK
tara:strand:+ start:143 stop:850 length:708 start_codon:yes stop_codon:yes gene_type:complete